MCQGIRFFKGPSNKVTFTPRVEGLEKGVFAEGSNCGGATEGGPTGSAEKNLPIICIQCFGVTDPQVSWYHYSAPTMYTKARIAIAFSYLCLKDLDPWEFSWPGTITKDSPE